MFNSTLERHYRESTIEEEPILGRVLALPDGRVHPLTWFDRLLLALHLASAQTLERKYFAPAAVQP